MRAHGRERQMGRRFAIVIGVAAAGVMALGAQTAAAPEVVKYDTKLTLTKEGGGGGGLYHGWVKSDTPRLRRSRACHGEAQGARSVRLPRRPRGLLLIGR
jgi:hypothetical protein